MKTYILMKNESNQETAEDIKVKDIYRRCHSVNLHT